MHKKKRVLFISEAAYLNTGYAKYSKEVISRLYATNKYEIAEFSIYGNEDDPRRSSIPWKNYCNMPPNNDEQLQNIYNSNPVNQFGAWRFERVCLDFEPDIILTIRDFWMDSFIYHSPYRRIFSWAWMPTVDASPQNQEWLDIFSDADYVLTYSDWAKNVLENEGGSRINTIGVASPSASECFYPMDRLALRQQFNLPLDVNIVGTVMRNQRRKLFPALIESFAEYIRSTNSTNTYLYLHTSFPDAGWNLAELIHSNGLSSRVLMTYVCENCKNIEASPFRDIKKVCSSCRQYASSPSNVGNGVPDEQLAKIYNLFDLYVQCANSEGFGLPQVEAAACGTPIVCTNYSAMEDVVNKLGAYPIDYSYYKELETGCNRAVPDHHSLTKILKHFFIDNDSDYRQKRREETRKLFEENYNWDSTTQEWMKAIDDCEYADWKQPMKLIPPQKVNMDNPSHSQFMNELMDAYCYYQPHKNSHFSRAIQTDLQRGVTKASWDGFYVSEFSPLGNNRPKAINREGVIKTFEQRLQNYNIWEEVRLNRSKLTDHGAKWLA
jgi:glycosyltransferase involved in cell wall biosynthesis